MKPKYNFYIYTLINIYCNWTLKLIAVYIWCSLSIKIIYHIKNIFSILRKVYQESKTQLYKNSIWYIPKRWNKHNGFSQRDLKIPLPYDIHNDTVPLLHPISGFRNLSVFKYCQFSWWMWKQCDGNLSQHPISPFIEVPYSCDRSSWLYHRNLW